MQARGVRTGVRESCRARTWSSAGREPSALSPRARCRQSGGLEVIEKNAQGCAMRIIRPVSLLVLAGLFPVLASGGAAAEPPTPTLVAIRAAHHPGFDRIVYEFKGGLPARHSVRYVNRLIGDASARPVPIAGRAILVVRFAPAQANDGQTATVRARKSFALPNIMTTVRSGDFEGVTSYGIGLAKRTAFHVFSLRNPSRVVID